MPSRPIAVGPGTLTIGVAGTMKDLSARVTSVKLVPSVDTDDAVNVLSGDTYPGDRTETWAITGTILQDLGTVEATTAFLFEHRGEQMPFELVPNAEAGIPFAGNLVVEAIEMGGDVKTRPTSDFEFALVGPPVMGDAVPAGG